MKTFHTFPTHNDVTCFHCNDPIGQPNHPGYEGPLNYGFPKGQFGMWCARCVWRTYYDTPDQSIKFDAKGDRLIPTCSCGCTTPKNLWEVSMGWPRCPDCEYV